MEIIGHINWVDVLVIILIIRIGYVGLQEGLSHEIFPLLGSLAIIIIDLRYYAKIGTSISQHLLNMPLEITNFLTFLVLAIIIGFLIRLFKLILDKIIKVQLHPLIERAGGLIAGVVRASLVASIVLMTIALAPLPYLQRSVRDRSLTGMQFLRIGPTIYTRLVGSSANEEEIMKDLVSNKPISPEGGSEWRHKKAEWEKYSEAR